MKKSILFITVALFISHLNILQLNAQPAGVVTYSKPLKLSKQAAALNARANKHFSREFKNVHNGSWSKEENGYCVRFIKDDIRYIVDYNKKGNWVSTIKSYDETKLSIQIANAVKTAFLGYFIVWVTELKVGNVTAHLVKIEGKDLLKTIRVLNDEFDVIEEYTKK